MPRTRHRFQPAAHFCARSRWLCSTLSIAAFRRLLLKAATPSFATRRNHRLVHQTYRRDSALPVMVIVPRDQGLRGDSAADLIRKISTIQAAARPNPARLVAAASGFTGISVHNIGETRTLVLFNGKRIAAVRRSDR